MRLTDAEKKARALKKEYARLKGPLRKMRGAVTSAKAELEEATEDRLHTAALHDLEEVSAGDVEAARRRVEKARERLEDAQWALTVREEAVRILGERVKVARDEAKRPHRGDPLRGWTHPRR